MRFDMLAPTLVRSSERAIIWRHGGHHHVLPPPLCRRQFLQTLAGGTALGAALGTGLLRPQRVDGAAPDINDVVPIPGTFEFQGEEFHVLGPPLTAPDDDPSTVFNFRGATGIAFISGTCTRTNRRTGKTRELPFSNHMSFMQGIYRKHNGNRRAGTFAFVWIDVFDPSMGDVQIHDFNPGITPKGLFWTVFVPRDSVEVDLQAGTASLTVRRLPMHDYFTLENALVGGGDPPQRAVVSFKVVWETTGERMRFDNAEQQFRGVFRLASAQMKWSARTEDFTFQSAPLETSTTDAAELGRERNGSFYDRGEEEDEEG